MLGVRAQRHCAHTRRSPQQRLNYMNKMEIKAARMASEAHTQTDAMKMFTFRTPFCDKYGNGMRIGDHSRKPTIFLWFSVKRSGKNQNPKHQMRSEMSEN